MPTAKKLPSGSWRCRVYSHTDENGKKIYKSFTNTDPSAKGKRMCEAEATAWASDKENKTDSNNFTFKQASTEFIELRSNVISPRTYDTYRYYINAFPEKLLSKNINQITQKDIQSYVNTISKSKSPKTVSNIYGFISSVFKQYRPDFAIRAKLPKKKAVDYYIPSEDEIKKLLEVSKGTMLELPILLAAFGPMRRGEICALRSENINGNTVHVCENMVKKIVDNKNTWIIKTPKTKAGDRYIEFPEFVSRHFIGLDGRICNNTPDSITEAFTRLLNDNNIHHFRFHDLRHYSASIQHALGVPDQYIMLRGGWSSDRTLKQVYRHSLDEHAKKENARINAYFEQYDTEYDTK